MKVYILLEHAIRSATLLAKHMLSGMRLNFVGHAFELVLDIISF